MSALKIERGASSHSAYDLRDYHAEVQAIGDFIELEAAKISGGNVVPLVRPA